MMPTPISSPLPSSLRVLNVPSLIEYSANVEIATAIRSDSNVIGMSYDIGIGKRNASMPMKCIDQMPVPSENPPPICQYNAVLRSFDAAMGEAKASATEEEMTATTTERTTSQLS